MALVLPSPQDKRPLLRRLTDLTSEPTRELSFEARQLLEQSLLADLRAVVARALSGIDAHGAVNSWIHFFSYNTVTITCLGCARARYVLQHTKGQRQEENRNTDKCCIKCVSTGILNRYGTSKHNSKGVKERHEL